MTMFLPVHACGTDRGGVTDGDTEGWRGVLLFQFYNASVMFSCASH